MTHIIKQKKDSRHALADYATATATVTAAILLAVIAIQQMPSPTVMPMQANTSSKAQNDTPGLNRKAVMPSNELNKGHIDHAIGSSAHDAESHAPRPFGAVYTMPSARSQRQVGSMT